MALTDAVDVPDALLELHRIPGQVIIDQQVGDLQIQSLGGGVRAQQDIDVSAQKAPADFLA